jgi:hypothetical protein
MRSPRISAAKIPASFGPGATVRHLIQEIINNNPELPQLVNTLLRGGSIPEDFRRHIIQQLRDGVAKTFCGEPIPPYQGLQRRLFEIWILASGDPDTSLPAWLKEGAPLGLANPAQCHCIFPTVPPKTPIVTEKDIHSTRRLGQLSQRRRGSGSVRGTPQAHGVR